jgi:hypothetical protein
LLQLEKVDIVPTDNTEYENTYAKINIIDSVSAVKKYNTNVLMTIFPPYNDKMAYNALKKFKGEKVVYIGESAGGCTGCDKFHDLLQLEWKLEKKIDLQVWFGMRDALYLYTKI